MSDFPPYDGTTPKTPLYDQTSTTVPPVSSTTDTPSSAGEKASQTKDEAKNVASDAQDATKHVAGVTKDQASNVASEAKSQTKDLFTQATSELKEQAGAQQQKAATGLRSVGDELSSMADKSDGNGVATELVRNLSDRAESIASWLDGRDPGSLLDEVKSFAARKPGTFIAIAAGAGILAGRLTKSLAAEAKNDNSSTSNAPAGGSTGATERSGPAVTVVPDHDSYTDLTAPVPAASPADEYADVRTFDEVLGSETGDERLDGAVR